MATRIQKQEFHRDAATKNELTNSLNRKKQVDIAVLDLSKAFDKV